MANFGGAYSPIALAAAGPDGIAHLAGLIIANEGKEAGALLFTVPPAARPKYKQVLPFWDANNGSSASLMMAVITPNGEVRTVPSIPSGNIPSLSGCSYPLDH